MEPPPHNRPSHSSDEIATDQTRTDGPPDGAGSAPPTSEAWELTRRSVAMLPPGAWALRREESLQLLSILLDLIRAARRSERTDATGPAGSPNRATP